MTLKHYLFILIALLVLGLGGLQLLFIQYLQQQVDAEVVSRTETLSNMAVEVIQENLHQQIKENVVIRNLDTHVMPESSATDVKMIIVDTRNAAELGMSKAEHNQYLLDLGDKTEEEIAQIKRHLDQMHLDRTLSNSPFVAPDIKIQRVGESWRLDINNEGKQDIHRQVVKFAHRESAPHRYFNNLMYVSAALTLIGLFCAFWLAHKVSQPFLRLNQGFKKLAKGEFGVQVQEEGIEDVRLTLQQFNTMSGQLRKLHEMEQRMQQHEQLAEIGEVSRGLAHTLRNPLNTIGLAVEQICHGSPSEQQKLTIAQQIREKIQHLDKTIKAMMNLTAQDIDRSQPVDINQLIQDIVMELRFSSNVTIDFQSCEKFSLKGSESEFRTILHSLLSNAVEASQDKDKVTVAVEQTNSDLIIRVADQGEGLSDGIRDNLFKPHVSSKAEGAGMGLFIAQRLCVSRYQGNIRRSGRQQIQRRQACQRLYRHGAIP